MKFLVAITLLLVAKVSLAQNLVPNPSFEDHSSCPVGNYFPNELNLAVPWYNPSATSPDYFNSCANNLEEFFGVPNNFQGYQLARTGSAYAGIYVFGYGSTREYLQVELTDTLEAGEMYCAGFYAALAHNVSLHYAITELAMLFTNEPLLSNGTTYFDYQPQIISPAEYYLSDTANWMEISGSYMANGGERYITIGNFNSDSLTDTLNVPFPIGSFRQSYYYIDDVRVFANSLECDLNTSSNHQPVESKLSLYPTISHQAVNIAFPQGSQRFNIVNAIGQSVYRSDVTSRNQEVDVSGFSNGVYFVRVQSHQGVQIAKFIVQHD